jgi:hypothetical protein
MTYKSILIAPVLGAVLTNVGITEFAMAQTQSEWDQGAAGGRAFADSDFRLGNGVHGSCDDHGFGDRSTDFCLGFKSGYLIEWGVMSLAH